MDDPLARVVRHRISRILSLILPSQRHPFGEPKMDHQNNDHSDGHNGYDGYNEEKYINLIQEYL